MTRAFGRTYTTQVAQNRVAGRDVAVRVGQMVDNMACLFGFQRWECHCVRPLAARRRDPDGGRSMPPTTRFGTWVGSVKRSKASGATCRTANSRPIVLLVRIFESGSPSKAGFSGGNGAEFRNPSSQSAARQLFWIRRDRGRNSTGVQNSAHPVAVACYS